MIIIIDLGSCKFRAASFDEDGECLKSVVIASEDWQPWGEEQIKFACNKIAALVDQLELITFRHASRVFIIFSHALVQIEQFDLITDISSNEYDELQMSLGHIRKRCYESNNKILHDGIIEYQTQIEANKMRARCVVTFQSEVLHKKWMRMLALYTHNVAYKCVFLAGSNT